MIHVDSGILVYLTLSTYTIAVPRLLSRHGSAGVYPPGQTQPQLGEVLLELL